MVKPATTIHDTAGLTEALEIFRDRSLRGLPVVNDGKLVGVVTRADLLRAMLHQWEEATNQPATEDLEEVLAG